MFSWIVCSNPWAVSGLRMRCRIEGFKPVCSYLLMKRSFSQFSYTEGLQNTNTHKYSEHRVCFRAQKLEGCIHEVRCSRNQHYLHQFFSPAQLLEWQRIFLRKLHLNHSSHCSWLITHLINRVQQGWHFAHFRFHLLEVSVFKMDFCD